MALGLETRVKRAARAVLDLVYPPLCIGCRTQVGEPGALCAACVDQEVGSAFLKPLDAGPIAQAGVNYTVIETLNETVLTPVGSSFIHESGVKNMYVQSQCLNDTVDHADLAYDQVTIRDVLNALDPAHTSAPNCLTAFPFPA